MRPVAGTVDGEAPQVPLLAQLRRRWVLILLTTGIAAGAAYEVSSLQPETYTATALALVEPSSAETIVGVAAPADAATQGRSTATIAALARARPVAEATARQLAGFTASDVQRKVTTSVGAEDNVLQIQGVDTDPQSAARLVNAFVSAFQRDQTDRVRRSARSARNALVRRLRGLDRAMRAGATGQALKDQIERLSALEALAPSRLSVVQQARAPSVGNSQVRRDTILGALFGLLVGCGIALLREQADHRVRRGDDLEAAFGLPVLSEVPRSRAIRKRRPAGALSPGEQEAFRLLWTRLRFGDREQPLRRVLITSAAAREGKSVISWYLASTAALGGARVLLVEADVRRPVFAERYGLEPAAGLLGLVGEGVPLAQALSHVPLHSPQADGDGPEHRLDVLAAGGRSGELSDVAATERVLRLLRDEVDDYELVVVDAPPIGLVAEAIPLSTAVDGVLIASLAGRSDREGIAQARTQLERVGARPVGIVLDGGVGPSAYYAPRAPAAASAS